MSDAKKEVKEKTTDKKVVKVRVSKMSKSQIQEWKDAGKKPVEVVVPVDEDDVNLEGEVAEIWITRPNRAVLNSIASYSQKGMFSRINTLMIKNCVLGGDEDYITEGNEKYDDDIFETVMNEISNLTEKRRAKVKKY
jgi:hypothetical protein